MTPPNVLLTMAVGRGSVFTIGTQLGYRLTGSQNAIVLHLGRGARADTAARAGRGRRRCWTPAPANRSSGWCRRSCRVRSRGRITPGRRSRRGIARTGWANCSCAGTARCGCGRRWPRRARARGSSASPRSPPAASSDTTRPGLRHGVLRVRCAVPRHDPEVRNQQPMVRSGSAQRRWHPATVREERE